MSKPLLDTEIQYLPSVGPKRAASLNKELGIFTYRDLLYHFPFKYIDRRKFYKINEITPDLAHVQIKGTIVTFKASGQRYKQRLSATFSDGSNTLELIWFKGLNWVQKSYRPGEEYIIFGKPTVYGNKLTIAHPEIELAVKRQNELSSILEPQYSTTDKLKENYITSKVIQKLVLAIFQLAKDKIEETLPTYLIQKHHLVLLKDALYNVHFPNKESDLKNAQYRLKFEELFYIQLNILKLKFKHKQEFNGHVFSKVGDNLNSFYSNKLTFTLTDAQKRVIKEIRKDLGSGKQMNRLLQGDVGSGKTMVALMSMLIALDNGFQACLMAPTEILAIQHYNTINKMLDGMDVNVNLLTGSTKTAIRKTIHAMLSDGKLHILIGTHALLEEAVQFNNLGLVIIDEQHRFGVAQRAKLWAKNIDPPHILVMTATPIPRTLAMTLYGDLDISVIDELPPGRKPIQTFHYFDSKREALFGFMRRQIASGRQIYVVFPLIKESEAMDYKDLEDGYDSISRAFPPPKYAVGVIHGRMKAEDKDISMKQFIKGITHILVATTVIEVGVDVPNASVMVIESAERFGLSQLHQLRGRVGRGADQSYCILMSSYKLSTEAKKRIETMVNTNDGFEIAEADLKLRGPGDIEGTQQSGVAFDLKIANLSKDGQIIQIARDVAMEILETDSKLEKPENQVLVKTLIDMKNQHHDWSIIS
jgi:ATP-dependent DNA helicase RecG